jgi:hypothetical protein
MPSEGAPLHGQPAVLWGIGVPWRTLPSAEEWRQRRLIESKVPREPSRGGGEGSGFLKLRSRNGGGGAVSTPVPPSVCVERRMRGRGFVYKEVVFQAGEVLPTDQKVDLSCM